MAKEIPGKEFKSSVKEFNTLLKKNEESTIKVVGVKKEAVVEEFTNKVLDYIEKDKAADLPDEVIDFYNTYIVEDEKDEEGDDAEKPKEKGKSKGKAKGKSKGKAKSKEKKGPGVVELAVEAYMKKGKTTKKEILEEIGDKFPGRNVGNTISNVVCVLKHVK